MSNWKIKDYVCRAYSTANKHLKDIVLSPVSWEYLYLVILALFLLHYFPQTIQYPGEWPRLNYNYIHTLLIIFVIFKYAFEDKYTFKKSESILFFLILLTFILSAQYTGYVEVFDTALLILGARNVRWHLILQTYLGVKIPLILATIAGSQLGLIEDLIYNQHGRIRESFGFIYPTDFAAQIFFAIVAWVLIRQMKTSFLELGIMVLLAAFLKKFCDARCSVICIFLVVCVVFFLKMQKKIHVNSSIRSWGGRWIRRGCIVAPYVFGGTMILLCRFYDPDNPWMSTLNSITSQRLKYGKKTFDLYDVQMYGQYVEMWGNGGSTQRPADYTFIDCSYINILMRFGLLVFAVVLVLITFLMLRNYHNLLIMGMVVLVCLHSVMEHHLFEIHYNILLILPFALGAEARETKEKLSGKEINLYYIVKRVITKGKRRVNTYEKTN